MPVVGWNMRLNAYIPLQRGDRENVTKMLATAKFDLENGTSVLIFPEGTRSRDGQLEAFKAAAFELAVGTGLPVLPIVVSGTGAALSKRSFVLQGRHPITLTVLAPIPSEGHDDSTLLDLTRAAIAAQQGVQTPA